MTGPTVTTVRDRIAAAAAAARAVTAAAGKAADTAAPTPTQPVPEQGRAGAAT
jgi:hypothetical protein